jgi:hypothetical protein
VEARKGEREKEAVRLCCLFKGSTRLFVSVTLAGNLAVKSREEGDQDARKINIINNAGVIRSSTRV